MLRMYKRAADSDEATAQSPIAPQQPQDGHQSEAFPAPSQMTTWALPPNTDEQEDQPQQHGAEDDDDHSKDLMDQDFLEDEQLQRELKAAFGDDQEGADDREGVADDNTGVWQGPIYPIIPARKRMKTYDYRTSPSPEGSDSRISTATSTPVLTACRSPVLSPQPSSPLALPPLGGKDYSQMSVMELREQLLGPSADQDESDLAVGWERAELIAVLEEMDRICMPAMQALRL